MLITLISCHVTSGAYFKTRRQGGMANRQLIKKKKEKWFLVRRMHVKAGEGHSCTHRKRIASDCPTGSVSICVFLIHLADRKWIFFRSRGGPGQKHRDKCRVQCALEKREKPICHRDRQCQGPKSLFSASSSSGADPWKSGVHHAPCAAPHLIPNCVIRARAAERQVAARFVLLFNCGGWEWRALDFQLRRNETPGLRAKPKGWKFARSQRGSLFSTQMRLSHSPAVFSLRHRLHTVSYFLTHDLLSFWFQTTYSWENGRIP